MAPPAATILREELERLFSLEAMMGFAQTTFGFVPLPPSEPFTVASFAHEFAAWCEKKKALDALAHTLVTLFPETETLLRSFTIQGAEAESPLGALPPGSELGGCVIEQSLGAGPHAFTYRGQRAGRPVILRVLRDDVGFGRARVQAYLAYQRMVFGFAHEGLPRHGYAGEARDHGVVCYEAPAGETVALWLARTGPQSMSDGWPVLQNLLETMAFLHERTLFHGNLKASNVLLAGPVGKPTHAVLLDGGCDWLRPRAARDSEELGPVRTAKIGAPELHRGAPADARSDVYALGMLLYEMVTGQPPFVGATASDWIALHMSKQPPVPSSLGMAGSALQPFDRLLLSMLHKDREQRPRHARDVLEALTKLIRSDQAARNSSPLLDPQWTIVRELAQKNPRDRKAVDGLEASLLQGADPADVATTLTMLGRQIDTAEEDEDAADARRYVLGRAAHVWQHVVGDDAKAEPLLARLVEEKPDDDALFHAWAEVGHRLGLHRKLLGWLDQHRQRARSAEERHQLWRREGDIFDGYLEDKDRALEAYARAVLENPLDAATMEQLERIAGTDTQRWATTLSFWAAEPHAGQTDEHRAALFLHLAHGWAEKLRRPEAAIPYYWEALSLRPTDEQALEGLAAAYRSTAQWGELMTLLLRRAEQTTSLVQARGWRFAAAGLLETNLNLPAKAREIYEQIFQEDPSHEGVQDALIRLYERTGEFRKLAALLAARLALYHHPAERARALCRVAEIYEVQLDDMAQALFYYRAAVDAEPGHVDALRGQERVFLRTGDHGARLQNLEQQLQHASTPRQRIDLLLRIAALHDEEFMDHKAAAAAYEAVLAIDEDHEASLSALVRHYRALEQWQKLAAAYQRLLDVTRDGAKHPDLLLARGRILAEQLGDRDGAMSAFRAAFDLRPEHAAVAEAIAKLRATEVRRRDNVPLPRRAPFSSHPPQEELPTKVVPRNAQAEPWTPSTGPNPSLFGAGGELITKVMPPDFRELHGYSQRHVPAESERESDGTSAVETLRQAIAQTDSRLLKARLYGEMARLLRDDVGDAVEAEEAAYRAFELDPTGADALTVLGDLCWDKQRFREAERYYEMLLERPDHLAADERMRVRLRYAEARGHAGNNVGAMELLHNVVHETHVDKKTMGAASRIAFEFGQPDEAYALARRFLDSYGDTLAPSDRAVVLYQMGESARRLGNIEKALELLKASLDIAPDSPMALPSLSKVYETLQDWPALLRVKKLHLATATGELRGELLAELADIFAFRLGDRQRAIAMMIVALEERPNDRRWLNKLVQYYGEEKEWSKLVATLSRLADLLEDQKQKAQYLHRAATISRSHLHDDEQAFRYYHATLTLDPTFSVARSEAIEFATQKANWNELEWLLRLQLDVMGESDHQHELLTTFDQLAHVYDQQGRTAEMLDALEAAQLIEPANEERNGRIRALAAALPSEHTPEASLAHLRASLEAQPENPHVYHSIRKFYTGTRQADASWCFCQALAVMGKASVEEQKFYDRMRSDTPAATGEHVSDAFWVEYMNHRTLDPLLTSVFALIEPALCQAYNKTLGELDYDLTEALTLPNEGAPIPQALVYAAKVLAIELPPAFRNHHAAGGLGFLHAQTPSILLGPHAVDENVAPQAATFRAARFLTYFRPGFYLRRLLPTEVELESWLHAAIGLVMPDAPWLAAPRDLVRGYQSRLGELLTAHEKESLRRVVPKFLETTDPAPLGRWVYAVDCTADRAGLLLANDLALSLEEMDRAGGQAASLAERKQQLRLFSVSEEYFYLRQQLAISLDE